MSVPLSFDSIPFRSRSTDYSVLLRTSESVPVHTSLLRLEIEDLTSPPTSQDPTPLSTEGGRFVADFTKQYIEDITRKTGNFKKFHVFVRMLLSAFETSTTLGLKSSVSGSNSVSTSMDQASVTVDMLTPHDLTTLKSARNGTATNTSQTFPTKDPIRQGEKRYLILTYIAEFDKVHYPLPLSYESDVGTDALRRTIRRLKDEKRMLKGFGDDNDVLRRQVVDLVGEIEMLRRGIEEDNGSSKSGELRRRLSDVERKYSALDTKSKKEIKALQRELTTSTRSNSRSNSMSRKPTAATTATNNENSRNDADRIKKLKNLTEGLRTERLSHTNTKKKAMSTIQKLRRELELERGIIKNLRLKEKSSSNLTARNVRSASSDSRFSIGGNSSRGGSRAGSRETTPTAQQRRNNAYSSGNSSRASSANNTPQGSRGGNLTSRSGTSTMSSMSTMRGRPTTPRSENRSKERFDPTAYQAEKDRKIRERDEARMARVSPGGRSVSSGGGSERGRGDSVTSDRSRASSAASREGERERVRERDKKRREKVKGRKGSKEPSSNSRNRQEAWKDSRDKENNDKAMSRVNLAPPAIVNVAAAAKLKAAGSASPARSTARKGPPQVKVRESKQEQEMDCANEITDINDRLASLQKFLNNAQNA